jgi:hypothetical protein
MVPRGAVFILLANNQLLMGSMAAFLWRSKVCHLCHYGAIFVIVAHLRWHTISRESCTPRFASRERLQILRQLAWFKRFNLH